MSDIVERLRAYAKNQGGWHNIDETCEAAADELTTLREKNNVLLGALKTLTANIEHAWPSLSHLGPVVSARAAIARAEGR